MKENNFSDTFLQNLIKGEEQYEDVFKQEPTVFERLMCDEDAMKVKKICYISS